MPSDSLTKKSIRNPGEFLGDWFYNAMKKRGPLKSPQDASLGRALKRIRAAATARIMAAHPGSKIDALKEKINNEVRRTPFAYKPNAQGRTMGEALDWDTENTRRWQGEAIQALVNRFLLPGAAVGAGVGLASQAPKLYKMHKDLKAIPDTDEEEGTIKKHAGLGADIANAVKSYGSSIAGGGVTTGISDAPVPYQGAMLTLGPAALAAGVIGGDKLLDSITDKMRARALRKRKDKLRRQFYSSILGKTASVDDTANAIIDSIYDTLSTKEATTGSAIIPGYLGLIATLLGTGALAAGYGISKTKDPLKDKAKALQLVLAKERLRNRYPVIPISSRGTSISDIMGNVDKDTYSMPIIVPNKSKSNNDEEEGTIKYPDLKDLYSMSKASNRLTDWWGGIKQKGGNAINTIDALSNITPEEVASLRTMASKGGDVISGVEKFKKGFGESWNRIKGMVPALLGSIASGASRVNQRTASTPVSAPAVNKPVAPQGVPVAKPTKPVLGPYAKKTPVAPAGDSIKTQREDIGKTRANARAALNPLKTNPLK